MKPSVLSRRVKQQELTVFNYLQGVLGCILILTAGCAATYDFTVPDGHPAKGDVHEPAYEPSQTLVESDPVETRPARSEHWDEEENEHEHHHDENHHDHGHHHNEQDLIKPQGAHKFSPLSRIPDFERLILSGYPYSHLPIYPNIQPASKSNGCRF